MRPDAERPLLKVGAVIVASAMVIGVLGRSIELLLPLILDSAARGLDLSNAALGLFAAAELAGVTLASLAGYRLAPRLPAGPVALFGALVLAGANLATPYADSTAALVGLRFIAGALGEGPLLVVALTILGSGANASRIYAVFMAGQMVFGAAALAAFGQIDARAGFSGLMTGLALLSMFGVAAALAQPFKRPLASGPSRLELSGVDVRPWANLAGMCVFHVGVSALWAFLQQKSGSLGVEPGTGGLLLSAMMLSGLVGTVFVMAFKGAPYLLLLTCLALGVAGPVAALAPGVPIYAAAGVGLMIAWNIAVPHQISQLGRDLQATRHLPLAPGFQGIGLAGGPALAGLVSTPGDYRGVAVLVVMAALVSACCFIVAGRRGAGAT